MKHHIIRVIAVVTAVLMLLSIVPAAALQELSLPNLMSAVTDTEKESTVQDGNASENAEPTDKTTQETEDATDVEEPVVGDVIVDDEDYDFADDVVLGKDYSEFVGPTLLSDGAKGATDLEANGMVNKTLSPYEPYKTELDEHPFLPYGTAWIDLSKIYYGAPATQNFPVTDWSANTSVYNITGTGKTHSGGLCDGEEIYLFPDSDLIDGYTWVGYSSDERLNYAEHDENGNIVLDESNHIVYTGISEHGVASSNDQYYNISVIDSKNDEEAFAYNRYDAMQGKYGITIDRNASMVRWSPSFKENYYPSGDAYYGSVVYISDTPYLYFSTEALDTTQIAISLLIGTPVQTEVGENGGSTSGTRATNTGYFEYRWYTITDNSARPGVANDSRNLSMIPMVTVSDPVGVFKGNSDTYLDAFQQQNGTIIPGLESNGKLDPIALAEAKGIDTDTLFTDGAITGCYDFTNILPTIMASEVMDGHGNWVDKGREDVQIKISQVRVDVRTKEGAEDSASRINYLYFGPSLVTTYLPQTTDGSNICAANWQYSQQPATNPKRTVGAEGLAGTTVHTYTDTATERAYTSGWENGAAVSIVNTPETPHLLTVDIHGRGDGQLIDWADVPADASIRKGNTEQTTKVWKFTDNNGVVQYMEAERCDIENGTNNAKLTGNYYVMVTVPIRKWVNILGEARKISVIQTVLQNGKDASGETNSALSPCMTFWGNDEGAYGPGHGSVGLGTRFRYEDILMVFGQYGQIYHIDRGSDYFCATVDRTIGDGTIYNAPGGTVESWYDTLRSPYFYDQTVKGPKEKNKLTDGHAGYSFVTSLRFAMPIDSAMSIQNMKGDGNSAGLNTYSATGSIVSAYDGGTGAQPEINVSNTLPEKNVTITKTGTGNTPADYTYTYGTEGDGTIKGTINVGDSSAYGPMLRESYYTIYDLLDTELITATSEGSHKQSSNGKANIPVYGDKWKNAKNEIVPIYSAPRTDSSIYGYVYQNCECTIYYRLNVTNSSGGNIESWGLTGVVTKGGTPELGWVPLWISGKSYSFTHTGGMTIKEESMTRDKVPSDWYVGRNQLTALRNSWLLSNMNGGYGGNFLGYDGTGEVSFDYGDQSADYAFPKDVHNPALYSGNTLHYANGWNDTVAGTNSGPNINDAYLYSSNGTDLVFGMKRNANTSKNWSVSMTRVFNQPITLKQGKTHIHASYPVLYVDYDVSNANGKNSAVLALSATVDGSPVLYHVYGNNYLSADHHGMSIGNRITRYFSFEDIMTQNAGKEIVITGLSMYMWVPSTANVSEVEMRLRRCEIWQEETDWLDEIIADNQQSGGNSSTAMNCQVKDSMNIINDAFYNVHNEKADGSYTLTKTDSTYATLTGFNRPGSSIFSVVNNTNANSLKKTNSNKGWSATITINDDDNKSTVGGNDTAYHSYDGYGSNGTYQYFSSVGNLRVWCPANTDGSIVFESDRSFGIGNYKYLYYSYSMRDVDTGISAEETITSTNIAEKGPGLALAIKGTQLGSASSYLEQTLSDGTRTLSYFPDGHAYWSEDGRDARTYVSSVNAAIDLSTLNGINSVNQIVVYINNPYDKDAEFYINYIKLSNVPPEELIANRLEIEGTQYYYMMDNTGDRYSARFPTLDNPTGQVSGLNADNDRVNPIIVERGARLSDGVYFNGDPIYTYGKDANGNVITGARNEYNDETASLGYYEKTYGTTDGKTGSMKNIMFYAGGSYEDDELTDIIDFYDYKAADGSVGDIYDMKWSYGRWDLGAGESGLNTMYIGDPDNLGDNDTANGVSGNLTRRYATENYVLLRAGITPRKYLTYFDAKGGQIKYTTSSEEMQTGVIQNLNNYYIDENVVFSYFKTPRINAVDESKNMPTKYGYVFDGWYRDDDASGDAATSANRLFKYTKKDEPNLNYFFASWKPAYELVSTDPRYEKFYLPQDTEYTVTFKHPEDGSVWYTRPANYGNEFQMLMPTLTRVKVDGNQMHVIGWQVEGEADGPVYAPGSSVTITKTVTFVAVTQNILESEDSSKFTHSVTVPSTVELKLFRDQTGTDGKPVYGDPASLEIKSAKGNGTTTYYNIPHSVVLVAVPTTAKPGYGWTMSIEADGNSTGEAAEAVCGVSKDAYKFSALSDVRLNYVTLSGLLDKDSALNGASGTAVSSAPVVFTTAAETTVNPKNMVGREMKFYTQFNVDHIANATVVAYGTLYTKSGANYDSIASALNAEMRLDEDTITAATIENGAFGTKTTAVRQVKATKTDDYEAANSSNQYYLMVTENKGNAVTYYARGYVIYKIGSGDYQVAYSDTVAMSAVPAATLSVEGV